MTLEERHRSSIGHLSRTLSATWAVIDPLGGSELNARGLLAEAAVLDLERDLVARGQDAAGGKRGDVDEY
jgi:hypothetical protein